MRKPDINRLNRSAEHLEAARTLLSSIKWEHRSDSENEEINDIDTELFVLCDRLRTLALRGESR